MARLHIHQFMCRSDNFGVLIHDPDIGATASIDAPETAPIEAALQEKGWTLTHIFITHHHFDHVAGNADLKAKYNCHLIGPKSEASKIDLLDQLVEDGATFQFAGRDVHVIETPGHTAGQVNYYIPEDTVAFTGDTLFALGCGRLFEETPAAMWQSFQKLMKLPEDTLVYCGHEYTLANLEFALSVDPDNEALKNRGEIIRTLRDEGQPTLPTMIGLERATNPFMRPDDSAIRAHLGMENASDTEVFTEIRKRKDSF